MATFVAMYMKKDTTRRREKKRKRKEKGRKRKTNSTSSRYEDKGIERIK